MNQIEIISSHGRITVDGSHDFPIRLIERDDPNDPESKFLENITRFDFVGYKKACDRAGLSFYNVESIDILDIGYWQDDGLGEDYCEPVKEHLAMCHNPIKQAIDISDLSAADINALLDARKDARAFDQRAYDGSEGTHVFLATAQPTLIEEKVFLNDGAPL